MEREFLDLLDWMNAGGLEGTGQKVEAMPVSPTPQPVSAPVPPTTTTPSTGGTNTSGKSREQIEAEGRAYDAEHGLMGGYYDTLTGQWVNGSPRSGGGRGVEGFGGEFSMDGAPSFENWPWPVFDAPKAPRIDPFVFRTFEAPTFADALKEPGYEFARDQGAKMLENSAAARGVLRSGGTLKDILEYGNKFAEQNYGNVFNRARDVFNTNEGNRFAAAGFNRDSTFNTFDRDYRGAFDTHRSAFDASNAEFQGALQRWMAQLNSLTQLSRPVE